MLCENKKNFILTKSYEQNVGRLIMRVALRFYTAKQHELYEITYLIKFFSTDQWL